MRVDYAGYFLLIFLKAATSVKAFHVYGYEEMTIVKGDGLCYSRLSH